MTTRHREHEPDYGYLSYQHHIVLNLEEVNHLVRTVTEELGTCELTPFLFSSLTINIISAHVCHLIQAFLHTCVLYPAPDMEYTWCKEYLLTVEEMIKSSHLFLCILWMSYMYSMPDRWVETPEPGPDADWN